MVAVINGQTRRAGWKMSLCVTRQGSSQETKTKSSSSGDHKSHQRLLGDWWWYLNCMIICIKTQWCECWERARNLEFVRSSSGLNGTSQEADIKQNLCTSSDWWLIGMARYWWSAGASCDPWLFHSTESSWILMASNEIKATTDVSSAGPRLECEPLFTRKS